jgi:hypothetical protein
MQVKVARIFAGRHALFRKKRTESGIWWEDCEYYVWWEYLKRHEGYRLTCESGGKGPCAALYADFGNIYNVSFKDWWNERGADLFAEPPSPTGVMELTDEQVLDLIQQGRDDRTLLIAVPLYYRKRAISAQLRKILLRNHSRKRGEKRVKFSRAKYPLLHAPDVPALKTTLDCYDMKSANPHLPLWQIAQEIGVSVRLTKAELEGTGGHVVDKKASMTAGVSRKLKHAATLIEGVGRGIFPLR